MILNILIFLLVIGVLVLVHELGHFIAAKACGIQVDAFAIGFGPKVFGIKLGETEYKINLLPFGGYVKMAGEGDYTGGNNDNPRSFEVQPAIKKLIVILAGVTMNFILACVIYTWILATSGFAQYVPQIVPNHFPFGSVTNHIGFQADPSDTTSPIAQYHLDQTYLFETINGQKIDSVKQVTAIIGENKGKPIAITFTDTQGQHERTIQVTPRENPPKGKGSVGIGLSEVSQISFSGWQKPFAGILYASDMLQYNVSALFTLVSEAIQTHTGSLITNNLTGPVGIYEVTGAVFQSAGFAGIINIIALLSLALAFMNVLPLPVLDGGFALIILIESAIRRPLNAKAKAVMTNVGIALLIALMLFVTYNDINNFDIVNKFIHLFRH